MTEKRLTDALELFALSQPFTREQLDQKREALLHIWTPRRFANLTNNPKKYMQAYTKAEEMTRLVEASYTLLLRYLKLSRKPMIITSRKVPREKLHPPDDQNVMSQGPGRVTTEAYPCGTSQGGT
jgi:hypothetical protein